MKKILAIAVVIIVLAAGGWFAFGRNTKTNTGSPAMDMPASSKQPAGSSEPSATNAVTIQSFAFSPASITVKKGATVTWTNQDSAAHTVIETDSQTGPNSPDLSKGKSYSFTFDSAGTYHYHCSIHPSMTGTVTVTE
jgi:plastocyanin